MPAPLQAAWQQASDVGLWTEFQNQQISGIGLRWSPAASKCGLQGGKVSISKILMQESVPSHWWLYTHRNGCSLSVQPAAARLPFGNCQYCLRMGSSKSLGCSSAYWLLWDCRRLNGFLCLTQSSHNPLLPFQEIKRLKLACLFGKHKGSLGSKDMQTCHLILEFIDYKIWNPKPNSL